jgi:hypothetical protein
VIGRASLVALAALMLLPLRVLASPPPLRMALEALAEGAEERRDGSWTVTLVDDELRSLVKTSATAQSLTFEGDGELTVSAVEAFPWSLVWALLWSSDPGEVQESLGSPSEPESSYKLVGGQVAVCYESDPFRICFDELYRQVVLARGSVDGITWEVRATGDGRAAVVTRQGSQVARFRRSRDVMP